MTVPATVEKIGIGTFSSSGISSVKFENDIKKVPTATFNGCSKLEKVTFAQPVSSIGPSAFADCVKLVSFDQESFEHVGAGAFYGCRSLEKAYVGTKDEAILYATFFGCDALEDITIPDNIKDVGIIAFASCNYLEKVNASGVETIMSNAFSGAKLSSITLSDNLKFIGTNAFSSCDKLGSLKVPSSVVYIGAGAFDGTKYEKDLTGDFIVLGDGVFYKYNGSNSILIFPDNTKRISANRLTEAGNIDTVILPENVAFIAKYAFSVNTKSSDSSSVNIVIREIVIEGKKGTYAETFANHIYYTFKAY